MIIEYHYCQYARTQSDAEVSLKGFKIVCDGCMRTCVNHVSSCAVHVLSCMQTQVATTHKWVTFRVLKYIGYSDLSH